MTALALEHGARLLQRRPIVLVADGDAAERASIAAVLRDSFTVVEASSGAEVIARVEGDAVDAVVMNVRLRGPEGDQTLHRIKAASRGAFVPVVLMAPAGDEASLLGGLDLGADDFLTKPLYMPLLEAKLGALLRMGDVLRELRVSNDELNARRMRTESDYEIARAIFRHAGQRSRLALPGLSVRALPLETFNGDFVLVSPLAGGRLRVFVGDFAGHGLSAAVGALPVSDVFHSMTDRGFPIDALARELGGKLHRILPRNLFLSACIADIDPVAERAVVWNGGLPDLLLLGDDGVVTGRTASQHPPLGVLASHEMTAETTELRFPRGARLVLFTDGLVEATSARGDEFGQERLERALAEGRGRPSWIDDLWESFARFCSDTAQRDDVTLVGVENCAALAAILDGQSSAAGRSDGSDEIAVHFRFDSPALRGSDPLAPLRNVFENAPVLARHSGTLSTVAAELFANALEHGLLGLDSRMKEGPGGFSRYYARRKSALDELTGGIISVSLQVTRTSGKRAAIVTVRDDGSGFPEELLRA